MPLFKGKASTLDIEMTEKCYMIWPKQIGLPDEQFEEMRGTIILKLAKAAKVSRVSAEVSINCWSKLPGATETTKETIWSQESVAVERLQVLDAGEHRFPIVFRLENSLPTAVGLVRKNWELLIGERITATVCREDKADLQATIPPSQTWILSNPCKPGEVVDPIDILELYSDEQLGNLRFTFYSPAQTIGEVLEASFTVESAAVSYKLISVTVCVEQKVQWTPIGSNQSIDPFTERFDVLNFVQGTGTLIPAASSETFKNVSKLPDHFSLTAATDAQTISPLSCHHDLIINVMVFVQGTVKQFSIRREMDLMGCGLSFGATVPPTYDAAQQKRETATGARTFGKFDKREYPRNCHCSKTIEDLLSGKSHQENTNGESLAHHVKSSG